MWLAAGALVEFPSVVEAVRCALEIQAGMARREAGAPPERRMRFRIGINLGDVLVDGDDIYGDGVNVAARLEGLAEPGGVCVSEVVRQSLGNKLSLAFEDLGEQRVKNIPEPIRVFRVLPASLSVARRPERTRGLGAWSAVVAAVALAVALAGTALWWRPWQVTVEPASTARMALPLPDKPSIAVLPFENLSGDPEQDYFADGMTDDLITDLSKVSALFVIDSDSVFALGGEGVKVKQVAEDFGGRYVLRGSARRAAGKIRINAQLIDATSGRQIWAERYDRAYQDIFALQDEVIGEIVATLAVELTSGERGQLARRPTSSLEAYDYYLRAERRLFGYGRQVEALALYREAIALDPEFADAHAGLATAAAEIWRFDIIGVLPSPVARSQAYDSASRALALDPANARAYAVLALMQMIDGEHDQAIASARRAVSLDPNEAETYTYLATVLIYAGRPAEALAAMETAFRLNPIPPAYFHADLGWVLFFNRRYEEALAPLETARGAGVAYLDTLAMVYAQLGRLEVARAEVAKILEFVPFANLAYYRTLYAHHRRREDLELRLDSLRKAGVPAWPFGYRGRDSDLLDESAIADLTFGRTWIGATQNGRPFMQETSEDGTFAFRMPANMVTGTAWVEGGMICTHSPAYLVGRKACSFLFRNPEGTREDSNEYVQVSVAEVFFFSPSP